MPKVSNCCFASRETIKECYINVYSDCYYGNLYDSREKADWLQTVHRKRVQVIHVIPKTEIAGNVET